VDSGVAPPAADRFATQKPRERGPGDLLAADQCTGVPMRALS
jgi:hypothetical protein